MKNAELIECIKKNQVIQKLIALQDYLKSQSIVAAGPDETRPQDPCLWVHGLSTHFVLQIILPPKAGNTFTVNLRPVSETPHDPKPVESEAFDNFVVSNAMKTSNHGAYCQLDRKIPLEDRSRVVAMIGKARSLK